MCGIFGHWNRDGRPVDLHRLRAATTALRHRGPDDEGYLLADTRAGRAVLCAGSETAAALGLRTLDSFAGERFDLAFGFRRLAILDLSPAGHQPMAGAGEQHWIVFNGEIYNFVELRRDLTALGHAFRGGSDTEVVLAAYAQWGMDMVTRLRGMWSFALWDAARRELLLSRDRFGIKPLFIARDGAAVAFASEIKALAAAGCVTPRPDRLALGAFVALGVMPPAEKGATFFEDVHSVPAAHQVRVTHEAFDQRRYWSVPEGFDGPRDPDAAVARYRERFDESMRIHLRSDVPIGTCLSGGLDSSSIVASTARLIGELHSESITGFVPRTFSAVYATEGPWNERRFIEDVLARTGAEGHFVEPLGEQLLADLPSLVWHQEEPFATTSMFAQWCVMRLARQNGVTVLLDGQGADEVLGGYHSFFRGYLRGIVRTDGVRAARRRAAEIERVTGRSVPLLTEVLRNALGTRLVTWKRRRTYARSIAEASLSDGLKAEVRSWASGEAAEAATPPDLRGELLAALQSGSLPHLLRYEDRNSMAFSIEARVPFLDHELVESIFRSPIEIRIRDGWTKWVARKAVEDRLPDSITWRRDKVGFATPEHQWLELAEPFRAALDAASAEGWLNGRTPPRGSLWRHVVAGAWLQHFVKPAQRTSGR